MDKKKSVLNVSVSIVSRVVLIAVAILVRRLLIQHIGNDVNGLNSLFASIIGTLSVAELGVGRAIVYSMYAPIISSDKKQVSALYCLYGKLYRIIGLVILLGGVAIMPFLPRVIHDYASLNENVYLTFFLTLVSVVLTYLYSAKSSLIEAHKDNYITTIILFFSRLVKYALQIVAILVCRSFTIFIVCQILETLLVWIVTDIVVRKRHGDILEKKEIIGEEKKKEIIRNVKAMVMHKTGNVLVAGIDSIIISSFIGIGILGKYQNYNYIVTVIAEFIVLFFTPLTSIVGHLCAANDPKRSREYFEKFYSLNFILGLFFFLGYYAVIDHVVSLFFGSDLALSRSISFVITLNQFVLYMRNAMHLFRNASGAFYYDRWKPLAEGLINLVLSLILVMVLPDSLQITGVILATIITTLTICDLVEPRVVFRHVFQKSPKGFYIRNYVYIGLFTACLGAMTYIIQPESNNYIGVLVNGGLSVAISLAAVLLLTVFDRTFRMHVRSFVRRKREN